MIGKVHPSVKRPQVNANAENSIQEMIAASVSRAISEMQRPASVYQSANASMKAGMRTVVATEPVFKEDRQLFVPANLAL